MGDSFFPTSGTVDEGGVHVHTTQDAGEYAMGEGDSRDCCLGRFKQKYTSVLNQMDATVRWVDLLSSGLACSRVPASCRFRCSCEEWVLRLSDCRHFLFRDGRHVSFSIVGVFFD
jgi:hypothetical protein